ncbi:hypothetical protein EDC50_2876 [Vulcaniibacterium tengchongense]|uniref:Uncharacterized protein n=1 Tax=Vulcaniibacterium tengchongense TaxID=1273429 RepID=A0A3N4V3Y0_9GAMM|nr:hypothetical protein EDC50_2876 [Vulcaniibacterium tengchongense]
MVAKNVMMRLPARTVAAASCAAAGRPRMRAAWSSLSVDGGKSIRHRAGLHRTGGCPSPDALPQWPDRGSDADLRANGRPCLVQPNSTRGAPASRMLDRGDLPHGLHGLELSDLCGIGPAMRERLHRSAASPNCAAPRACARSGAASASGRGCAASAARTRGPSVGRPPARARSEVAHVRSGARQQVLSGQAAALRIPFRAEPGTGDRRRRVRRNGSGRGREALWRERLRRCNALAEQAHRGRRARCAPSPGRRGVLMPGGDRRACGPGAERSGAGGPDARKTPANGRLA